MKNLVSKLISKIKGREYVIDDAMTNGDLCSVLFTRFFMAVRGFFKTLFFKRHGKISFIGKRVTIKSKSHISCGSGLTIEDDCHINALCKNGVKIGNNFSLGRKSIIECTGVIRELGDGLEIGDNVGIAANGVTVLDGVKIGNGCVVAAGAVVTKDLPDYSIAVGSPAKVIKSRKNV